MSIKSRLPKARAVSKNVVLTLRKSPQVSFYGQRSLTDPATNYQQKVEWSHTETIEDITFPVVKVECHQVAGVGMPQPNCKGNENGTICYHSLAALIKKANSHNDQLSFFDSFTDAVRYANFGGKLSKVVSAQGNGYCWMVSREKESFKERVNLMRGEVEEGIE